jgi:hypothetical protein
MFLTNIDSRAEVKGSRDPLGLVPVWSLFGRRVVGNLTTVTGSVRGFTTTLLGYHFAREVQERDGTNAEATLGLFLKFEQLAGYCRYYIRKDTRFRGIERVKKTLSAGDVVTLSARPADQILSNQKVYGLWGLFSVPSRRSGLLERDEAVLTTDAQKFVEKEYLGALSRDGFRDGREIVELLRQRRSQVHIGGKHARLARALAGILAPRFSTAERVFYRDHLTFGGPQDSTDGRQKQLAELMKRFDRDKGFDRYELRALMRDAKKLEGLDRLADDLQRIDQLEAVLVPTAGFFGLLQARDKQTVRAVVAEGKKAWGVLRSVDADAFGELKGSVGEAFGEVAAGERWTRIAQSLAAGSYEGVLELLLEHNAFVMRERNGSDPWVRVAKGRLDVRFRDEASELPGRRELPDLWRNNYFLNPLKEVVVTLSEG